MKPAAEAARTRTAIYLVTGDPSRYVSILWLRGQKANELLLGFKGLAGGPGTLRYAFPPQELSEEALREPITFRYDEAKRVDLPVDHITCHADGRFHIAMQSGFKPPRYIEAMKRSAPLSKDTGSFLKLIVITDLPNRYTPVAKPGNPAMGVRVQSDQYLFLRGTFAGLNYPGLDAEMRKTVESMGENLDDALYLAVTAGSMKGMLLAYGMRTSPEAAAGRPPGTLVSFRFRLEGTSTYHIIHF